EDRQHDRALALEPPGLFVVFNAVEDMADVVEPDGVAAAVRDDHRRIRLRLHQLAVGLHDKRLVAVHRARRQVDVRVRNGRRHFVDPDAVRGELLRIDIDANCFSSGSATADAIVSGLAPGMPALTLMVGKSIVGRSLTGSWRYAIAPNTMTPSMMSVVVTGRLMNSADTFMASPSLRSSS